MAAKKRTYIYVDAFNLYYGSLKDTKFKWLNIQELCRRLLNSDHEILRLKYFTALVTPRPSDPDQQKRQISYLRALESTGIVEIVYGHFLTHSTRMPLVMPLRDGTRFVDVLKTEEKGSDVNLAVHLLNDGFKDLYDCSIVISNDSDLQEAIRIVSQELKKTVGILNPQKIRSHVLSRYATFYKPIRAGVLAASQFPESITDLRGTFQKPAIW
ncbi:MAG: NYN domain-containing protein [Leptospirales bacterium]|nr:NYN domain-containing protein [Leptospirales bacterium]